MSTSIADSPVSTALSKLFSPAVERPVLIAGPCSAETEAQVLDTARHLAAQGNVSAFRAGVWKPRTRPNAFEGIGEAALPWLQRVQEEVGLPVAVEVATARQVEVCLDAGIQVLWLGARTTVNPFYVQEIAEALRGTAVPVLVKNPVNPDLSLWLGAIERLQGVGIKQIAAVHRGFTPYEPTQYRNIPLWSMLIEFMRKAPEIPVLNDPSHIAGKRALVQQVAQQALDYGVHGLMVETHPEPDLAWSDAAQQLTPDALLNLRNALCLRKPAANVPSAHAEIEALRKRIDTVDDQILETFAQRMNIVRQIADVKREHGIMPLQLTRWSELLEARKEQGYAMGLPETLLDKLYQLIHTESLALQHKLINEPASPKPAAE